MSFSTLYFMHNLSLQPRSKLLYSTLPTRIALSNACEALGLFRNQNCQDMGSCWLSLFHQHISQILLEIFLEILEAASYILNMSTPWLEMRKKAVNGGSKYIVLLMIDYTHTSWH